MLERDADLEYEAAVHLDTPLTEGFYPEWDGPEAEEDYPSEEEIDACDPKRIFDALCDAGIM